MSALQQLIEYGQSYWLDNLTREMIQNGALKRRVNEQGLRGVTSNPTIFNKAIGQSSDYDGQIEQAVAAGLDDRAIYEELTTTDVRNACDILRPVYDNSEGRDGFVSLEVSAHLAHDAEASMEEARRLWETVNRPNLMIKIPGTKAGLPAIEQLLYEGLNINITLLFGIGRYEAVAEAYLRALERRLAEDKAVEGIASVASFFLSRIDVLTDELLLQYVSPSHDQQGPRPRSLLGKTAVANAKLAYQSFQRIISSDRWQTLADAGARVQRMLWASTSTKNPDYRDVMYVEPLIGPHTVNTLPEKTIDAFADHGDVKETVEQAIDQAQQVFDDLEALGIDIGFITQQLENEGVQKFIDPYEEVLQTIGQKRRLSQFRQQGLPLEKMARKLRRWSVRMTTEAGSGHATSSLSAADLVSALFFHEMRWDPGAPTARNVDNFVLSKGHAVPVLWAALYEAGAIDEVPLSLRRIDSTLEGHPTPNNPWIKVATGSLGQGLAAANGMALANRLDDIDARVYCLLGDGECSEGSVWEAAQFASLNNLSNLVAIVDANGLGQSGPAPYGHDTGVIAERFRAFGWQALEIDGHHMPAILDALAQAREAGPTAIVACTLKGKGVSFLEQAEGWHGKAVKDDDLEKALGDIGDVDIELKVAARRVGQFQEAPSSTPAPIGVEYGRGDQVATRSAYGDALKRLGGVYPEVVALDGDVKNSTHAEEFAEAYPERYFEGYIAEQNMVGAALGLAASGKIPYVSSFACFLTRAYDFIRMAGHSRPPHLVFCGSHAGISIGEDGPSQMGLEDLAMFRAVQGSTVLYPCDAVSAARLTEQAARIPGIVYLRMTRPKTPVIYHPEESFPVGGCKVLRSSADDRFTLVGAGITVHEALAANEALQKRGIATRVIDAYSVKPLDVETLNKAAAETGRLIVVEDHWIDGGLGDAVAAALGGQVPVHRMGVVDEPRSGKPEELMDRHGISRTAIEERVLGLVAQMGWSAELEAPPV